MTAPVIQFKRGLLANLPGLQAGEPGFTTDSYDLYVGIDSSTANNKIIGSHRFWKNSTASTGSGVNFVEGTTNGTQYITLKGPDNLSGITTYTFPATPTADYFLKTAADGTLSWAAVVLNSFAGIVTFTDATDNTLGNADTGAVQIDGGVGINKNLTVGGNLNVQGYSEFVGVATFKGGTINLGDSTGDDINVGGEFISGLYPNTSNTYDLGDGARQWRNGNFAGVVTATTFSGTATTATRATLVDTTGTTTNADYFVTFVDTLAGQTSETIRVGAGLSVNPSDGSVKTRGALSVGNAAEVNSYIKAGGGSNALYLYTNGDVSFQAKAIVNSIRSSSDSNDAITLAGRDATFGNNVRITGITTIGTGVGVTQFSASVSTGSSTSSVPTSSAVIDYVGTQVANVDLTLGLNADSGGPSTVNTSQTLTISGTASQVNTAVSGQTVTVSLPATVVVGTAVSVPTIKTATVQHSNGTQAATIDTSGNITASQNLTVSGNLYVNGSTTQVNTASMTVEDRTIELGVVDGSAPSSTTTWDLGVLFNYYDGSAKKSALIWEQGDARFKLGSVISDGGGTDNTSPQITFTTYAGLEIGSLWVNDCAGQSQVISCAGGVRTLENITIDAGTF